MQVAGCKMQVARCKMQGAGCRVSRAARKAPLLLGEGGRGLYRTLVKYESRRGQARAASQGRGDGVGVTVGVGVGARVGHGVGSPDSPKSAQVNVSRWRHNDRQSCNK